MDCLEFLEDLRREILHRFGVAATASRMDSLVRRKAVLDLQVPLSSNPWLRPYGLRVVMTECGTLRMMKGWKRPMWSSAITDWNLDYEEHLEVLDFERLYQWFGDALAPFGGTRRTPQMQP